MDLTKISPNKTGDGYQSIKESLNPDDLDLKMETARFKNPLRLEGEIVWFEKGLLFCVNVEGIKELICARCLEPFEQVFKKKMTFNYELVYRQPINVLPELSEELFVDHPIVVLCKEDCKGLCAQCGTNLNEQICSCQI